MPRFDWQLCFHTQQLCRAHSPSLPDERLLVCISLREPWCCAARWRSDVAPRRSRVRKRCQGTTSGQRRGRPVLRGPHLHRLRRVSLDGARHIRVRGRGQRSSGGAKRQRAAHRGHPGDALVPHVRAPLPTCVLLPRFTLQVTAFALSFEVSPLTRPREDRLCHTVPDHHRPLISATHTRPTLQPPQDSAQVLHPHAPQRRRGA